MAGPRPDAELVAVGAEFFKSVGLSAQQIVIKVNSRKLMEEQIARLGVTPDRLDGIYRLIDKLDKLPAEKWRAYGIDDIGLSAEQIDRLSELVGNRELWKESADLTAFFNAINDLGVAGYVGYDPSIIRGLAYYTGVVFEARDRSGEFRAILGGGRYDNLVADVGGEPLGGIGFALGDVSTLRSGPTRLREGFVGRVCFASGWLADLASECSRQQRLNSPSTGEPSGAGSQVSRSSDSESANTSVITAFSQGHRIPVFHLSVRGDPF